MNKRILGIGATLVDELYFCEEAIVAASSNPAQKTSSVGGVISNIMQHLALFDLDVSLITALGNDGEADFVKKHFNTIGVASEELLQIDDATGKYVSVLNSDGNLFVSVCEDHCSKNISIPFLQTKSDFIKSFDLIVIDTNLDIESIQWLIHFAYQNHLKLIIEPVSVIKAAKLAALDLKGVYMITPNQEELIAISKKAATTEEAILVQNLFDRGVQSVWIRKGAHGSVWHKPTQSIQLGVPIIKIIDSTGAGDAALAGWVLGWANGEADIHCLELGHSLALEVLKIKGTIKTDINSKTIYNIKKTYYND
ncbi:PfkB family carbohydrate kinase [Flavobacterium sp. SUN046]|uniref:PfkB family carbohydrate kinase n=1 Tax=Flavobacterium sp. SUN046 TaxID=3002440 RepID=UPI002DBC0019|nr:PfkB family carbohydrate kinase [Flavobacterium sp. SUN046]MEC4049922.1 PfkB family carbohydrate kinase [Flavobacterium sp. SUN046]